MAFPIEEGLKLGGRIRIRRRGLVFVAFPIEEGLKPIDCAFVILKKIVFVAFPIEEGLKLILKKIKVKNLPGFCGFSNRRRIETCSCVIIVKNF